MKKTKTFSILTFCLVFPLFSLSQSFFERQFGQISFSHRKAGILDNGEILLIGNSITSTIIKGAFIKTDNSGTLLSVKLATGSNQNLFGSLVQPGIIYYPNKTEIVSCTYNRNIIDTILQVNIIKMNDQLDTVWSYCYVDSTFTATMVNYFLAGQNKYLLIEKNSTYYNPNAYSEFKITELDTAGKIRWTKSFHYVVIPPFNITNVISSGNGGYYGIARDSIPHYFKTDSLFNVNWCRRIAIPFTSSVSGYYNPIILNTSAGKLMYVSGIGDTSIQGSFLFKGLFICELDTSSGAILWAKEIRADFPLLPHAICEASDGNLLIGGEYSHGIPYYQFNSYHGFLLKTDTQGNVIWGDSIYDVDWRDRVVGLQERDNKILISFDRYDDINAFPFFIVTDTAALTGCLLHRTPFYNFGNVSGIQDMLYPSFSPQSDTIYRFKPVVNISNGFAYPSYYCNALGTDENNFNEQIIIYPNPFSSEVSISLQKQNIKQVIITIKNVLGQSVFIEQDYNFSAGNTKTIELGFLSKGFYLLDVTIDGERTTRKIVKE